MSSYLIETTEVYRVNSEDEAQALIERAKNTSELIKYNSVKKERKMKGEVIDTWYKVSLTKRWDDEKEPSNSVKVSYGTVALDEVAHEN